MEKVKVIVTGGAGFIGSNICEYLVEKDIAVVCYDNLITGHMSNIEHLISNPLFKFFEKDIREINDLKEAMIGCTHVCHQAALGSVPRSISNPISTNDHNLQGTLNVFWAAKELGIKNIVYASSSSIYGDEKTLPKVEDRIGKPLSPYAVTKMASEMYATVFSELYGIKMIGLRYFNVFGRRQDPKGEYAAVIPKFIQKLISGQPIEIHGNGDQSRDFTYIDNVIQANMNALFTTNSRCSGMSFNIAFGGRVSINELYLSIKNALSTLKQDISNSNPTYVDDRPGDIKHSHADISKAKEFLNYDPQYDIETGLNLAIKWYWDNLS